MGLQQAIKGPEEETKPRGDDRAKTQMIDPTVPKDYALLTVPPPTPPPRQDSPSRFLLQCWSGYQKSFPIKNCANKL